jgi:riboflavin synthase
VAVNGVCLTVTTKADQAFEADLSAETLERTTFQYRWVGDRLNLEKAATLTQRLGGHLVSGHVDGIGRVHASAAAGRSQVLTFEAPPALRRYIVEKGSVCVDGVSLTVNRVEHARFSVNLIPHTLFMTTLDELKVGATVNLEVDLIARYLERLLFKDEEPPDLGDDK